MTGAARSRSLWDQTLEVPSTPQQGAEAGDQTYDIAGPGGRGLEAVARILTPAEDDAAPLRLVVAADRRVLAEPISRFNHMLAIALGALAAGLTAAAVVQVVVGTPATAAASKAAFPARSSRWSTISTRCWR
ncbi:hypothetical protein G6F57_020143 [Rhizopus arrhizus]|nr:hypothetical protein G6F57_020143 [Rhizopus arrhizus]